MWNDELEANLYTTEMTKVFTPGSWCYILYNYSQNKNDSNLPSRLEDAFILDLDSVASIFVLDKPTYTTINKTFKICYQNWYNTSKTLTVGNQSEVPVKQYLFIAFFSSIEKFSILLLILFAVAGVKASILGTPFFENSNFNIQDFTMADKCSINDQPTNASCTILIEKSFPIFIIIYQINSKKPTFSNPTFYKLYIFSWKIQKLHWLKVVKENQFLLKYLKLNFYLNWNDSFPRGKIVKNFWRFLFNNK